MNNFESAARRMAPLAFFITTALTLWLIIDPQTFVEGALIGIASTSLTLCIATAIAARALPNAPQDHAPSEGLSPASTNDVADVRQEDPQDQIILHDLVTLRIPRASIVGVLIELKEAYLCHEHHEARWHLHGDLRQAYMAKLRAEIAAQALAHATPDLSRVLVESAHDLGRKLDELLILHRTKGLIMNRPEEEVFYTYSESREIRRLSILCIDTSDLAAEAIRKQLATPHALSIVSTSYSQVGNPPPGLRHSRT